MRGAGGSARARPPRARAARGSLERGACALALALALAGCAAVPWPVAPRVPAAAEPAALRDLRGVVHVHTRGSHDSPGTLAQVVAAARQAGLAWVALTEHVRPGRLEAHGAIDGVTVLPGFEVRKAGGSILALGVAERPPRLRDPGELVGWIHAAGGLAFVGHAERSRLIEPATWAGLGFDGIELVNLHAALLRRRVSTALRLLVLPAPLAFRSLLAAPEENLERWKALPGAPGIVGGVDAHARTRLLGPLGGTVDRYRDLFRLLTTHVLAPDAETASILAALRSGRSYVALEGLAPVERFRFERVGRLWRLEAPRAARLVLACDGREIAVREERASALLPSPPDARRCRAEAWLGERLWIATGWREAAPEPAPAARAAPAERVRS